MITLLTVKMSNQEQATSKMAELLADAAQLGYVASGRKERQENGQTVITCLITPKESEQ